MLPAVWNDRPSILACLAFAPDGRTLAAADGAGLHVWELASGQERRHFPAPASGIAAGDRHCLEFSADGTVLASAHGTAILAWDVAGRLTPATRLDTAGVAACWNDLAGGNAARAGQAVWRLSTAPVLTVPYLAAHLQPAQPADAKQFDHWIAALDSKRFATRREAAEALKKVGVLAEPALRRALTKHPSAEVRRQLEWLREQAARSDLTPSPTQLREERALEVLEHINNPAARQVLRGLAKGAPEARLTREAEASLARMERRRS